VKDEVGRMKDEIARVVIGGEKLMNTKLTLRLDEDLIKKVKTYAAKRGISLSELVANYFAMLLVERDKEDELPPKLASLKGILKNKNIHENDYKKYVERKYL
jgi:hypothetical protein